MEMEQPSGDSQVQDEEIGASTAPDESEVTESESDELEQNEHSEDDEEELEEDLDGVKVRGKKEALERLKAERLMQADYTRKTQEVAEQRRAIETAQQQFEAQRQFEQQNLDIVADIRAIDRQISQLQQVNLMQLSESDPIQAQRLMLQLQNLQTQRGQAAGALAQRQQEFHHWQQQQTARQVEEGLRVLKREIPGFGPDLAEKLVEYGKSRGYPEHMLRSITSPSFVVDLYHSYQFAQAKKQATTKPKVVQDKPVTRVANASKAKAGVDPDKLSPEQWVKWRNSQIRSAK